MGYGNVAHDANDGMVDSGSPLNFMSGFFLWGVGDGQPWMESRRGFRGPARRLAGYPAAKQTAKPMKA